MSNGISIHTCGTPVAKIDGRTLRDARNRTTVDNIFKKFSDTEWVEVCPKCNVDDLVYNSTPKPFLCHDGVMRTKEDLDPNTNLYQSVDWNFAGFTFSKSALYSSIKLLRYENHSQKDRLWCTEQKDRRWWTENVEKRCKTLVDDLETAPSPKFREFSKDVCTWGGGERVWGKLWDNKQLAKDLCRWFQSANKTDDAEEAISCGIKIKGLGVSFASKHLRMLNPKRFAVLDDVLSQGLGFARNVKEYKVFMRMLREFQGKHRLKKYNVATLESGIFRLVRQQVRTRQSEDISGYPINKGTLHLFDSD